jgi:hypothetical protein
MVDIHCGGPRIAKDDLHSLFFPTFDKYFGSAKLGHE